MSLGIDISRIANTRFPRSRGDEPAELTKAREQIGFSPLTRG